VSGDHPIGRETRETPVGVHLVVADVYEAHDGGTVVTPLLPTQRGRHVGTRDEVPDGSGGFVGGGIRVRAGSACAPGHALPRRKSALMIDASASTVPSGSRIWIVELAE
jgi:hypothetical protein